MPSTGAFNKHSFIAAGYMSIYCVSSLQSINISCFSHVNHKLYREAHERAAFKKIDIFIKNSHTHICTHGHSRMHTIDTIRLVYHKQFAKLIFNLENYSTWNRMSRRRHNNSHKAFQRSVYQLLAEQSLFVVSVLAQVVLSPLGSS